MSAPKHTPEATFLLPNGGSHLDLVIVGRDGEPAITISAERALQCVEACRGMMNPADLRKQRDELLTLLKRVPFQISSANEYTPEQRKEIFATIDAAVARAEGRAQPAEHGPHSSGGALAVQDVHEAPKGEKCSGQHAHCLGCDALRVKRGEPIAPKGACT